MRPVRPRLEHLEERTTPSVVNPPGSLIYDQGQAGSIGSPGDKSSFSLQVDPGQKITVTVDPAGTLQPAVDLYRIDSSPVLIGTAAAGGPGLDAVLQTVATQGQIGGIGPGPKTYTAVVRGVGASTGGYTLHLLLNAAVEGESHDGAADNTRAAAQDLEPSFLPLNSSVTQTQTSPYPGRGAVLGRTEFATTTVFSADFESGPQGFTVDNTPPNGFYLPGLWHLSTGRGAQPDHSANHSFYYGTGEGPDGGGSISVGSFNPTTGAIVSPAVALPTGGQIVLDFNYVLQTRGFPGGVDLATLAVNDGGGWTTLSEYDRVAESSSWRASAPVDLTAYAGKTVQLRWSFDTVRGPRDRSAEGWYVDDVRIRQLTPTPDYYAFTLGAGESATLALRGLSSGDLALTLENAAGATLALGRSGATNLDRVISNFVATAAGTYYARVSGSNFDGTDYSLVVTRNADFNTEGNDSPAAAQDLISTQVAGQRWALGNVTANADLLDLRGTPVSGPLVLSGDKITLGINDDGSYIVGPTGIQFLGNEFVVPGTPLAGFTIGRDGVNFTNKGAVGTTDIAVTKEDISSGSLHGVRIVGVVGGNLQLERVVAFRDGDEFATIETRLTNLGGTTLSNVAWLENLDADQGQPFTGDFSTFNDVVLGGQLVRATAFVPPFPDGLTIGLGSADSRRVVSAEGFDNRDPFEIINSPEDPDGASDDIAINLAINYGSLAPAQSVSSIGIMTFGRSPAEADATYSAHTGGTSERDTDFYRVTVDELKTLQVQTATPADQGGEFANNLDPMVRVYNASGALMASDDNSAPDRRNASLSYKVPKGAGGTYYIEVLPSTATAQPTKGEYILSVKQANGALPPFQVAATDPASGTRFRVAPTAITVDFNDSVLLTSLQASDLTLDGVPATGVTVVDANTAVFALPGPLAEGNHVFRIAAGAIQDLQNTPIQAFAGSFFLDLTPPRIVGISLQEGDVAPAGDLTYTIQFSEAMRTGNLDNSDFSLVGSVRGVAYTPTSASYDVTGTVLTLRYSGLPDDNYTLTLFSGDGRFEDLVGFDLDGEPVAFPIPPNRTGDGVEGGNFFVHFSLDTGTATFPTPLTAKPPLGSLIYDPTVPGLINAPGDTDSFTLNLDAGQTLTAVVIPGTAPLYGGVGNGSFNSGALLLVDPTTGGGKFLGDPVTPGGLTGLAFDPATGVLFGSTIQGFGSTSKLVRIDPASGSLLSTVGTITDGPGGPGMSIGDLALQPGTGTLFGIRSNSDGTGNSGKLYTINKATGVATFIGSTGSGAGGGIAFAPDGSLYQTAFNSGFDFTSLNKLNPANAARISTVPIFTYFDGLAIRPSDGALFAATGGSGDAIYTIDPSTGSATFVGGTGAGSTSDLDFGLAPLAPTVEVRGPSGTLLGSGTAGRGQEAILQTVPISGGGTYTITVGGAPGTSGLYTLQAILNAAVELESHGGPGNNTLATAQDLGPSFIGLLKDATRGAALGRLDPAGDLYSFTLTAGQSVSAVAKGLNGSDVHLTLLDSGGNVVATGSGGAPLANGSFETGNFAGWTTTTTGSPFVDWTVSPAGAGSGFFPPTSPQDGTFDAWNGFDGAGPMQYTMTQDVTIPAAAPVAQFSWEERVQWDFALTGTATQPRTYEVEVLDPGTSAVLATLFSFSTGTAHVVGDTGWQTHTADLSAFKGQTVRLRFREDIPETFTGPGQIEFDAITLDVGQPQNVDDAISNYVAPAGGTYYVRVSGQPGTDYSVVVTRDAVFDLESNNSLAHSQPLGSTHVALGYVGGPGDPSDFYAFTAAAGQAIHLFTQTPADGPGEFGNTLNPHLRLYDPSGTLVAEGVPLADGRNEEIVFTAGVAGTYTVEVSAEGGTAGEYYLDPSPVDTAAATPSGPVVSGAATGAGVSGAEAPAVLAVRAPAGPVPGPLPAAILVSAAGPGEARVADGPVTTRGAARYLAEVQTAFLPSVSAQPAAPAPALPATLGASTTFGHTGPDRLPGLSSGGGAALPGGEGPAAGEAGLEEAGWGPAVDPWLAGESRRDGGAAAGALPAAPALPPVAEVGPEGAASCLAVDFCLADEDWVASLADRPGSALVELTLGAATLLAATGVAPQHSRERQREGLRLNGRR